MVTFYAVQSYKRSARGRLTADQPLPMPNATQAVRTALRISGTKTYVVAFSRSGDETTGDFGDAVILASYGEIPEEIEDAA